MEANATLSEVPTRQLCWIKTRVGGDPSKIDPKHDALVEVIEHFPDLPGFNKTRVEYDHGTRRNLDGSTLCFFDYEEYQTKQEQP